MMVVDASIAIKWLMADEPDKARALRILDAVESTPQNFAVPELFFNEVLAVLCQRTTASESTLRSLLWGIEQLGMVRIGNGHELLETAIHLARLWSVSGYAAIYLATAEHLGGVWLTADRQAARKVKKPGLVKVLGAV